MDGENAKRDKENGRMGNEKGVKRTSTLTEKRIKEVIASLQALALKVVNRIPPHLRK